VQRGLKNLITSQVVESTSFFDNPENKLSIVYLLVRLKEG
jgi:hypothetical protein